MSRAHDLSDLRYRIDRGSETGKISWLKSNLPTNLEPRPTFSWWYSYPRFCTLNNIPSDGFTSTALTVQFGSHTFEVSDELSWGNLIADIEEELASISPAKKLDIIEFKYTRSSENPPSPPELPLTVPTDSWLGYDGEAAINLSPEEHLSWKECCKFMSYTAPGDGDDYGAGKLLLGSKELLSPSEMLEAYHFFLNVQNGLNGIAVSTLGNPSTLKAQIAIICILRLLVLNNEHVKTNPDLHFGAGDETSGQTCLSSNPFGIQCPCQKGTLAHELARRLSAGPFLVLAPSSHIERVKRAMDCFYSSQILLPRPTPMLETMVGRNINGESLKSLEKTMVAAKNEHIILADITQFIEVLQSEDIPDRHSNMMQYMSNVRHIYLHSFQLPQNGSASIIKWINRMNLACKSLITISVTTACEFTVGYHGLIPLIQMLWLKRNESLDVIRKIFNAINEITALKREADNSSEVWKMQDTLTASLRESGVLRPQTINLLVQTSPLNPRQGQAIRNGDKEEIPQSSKPFRVYMARYSLPALPLRDDNYISLDMSLREFYFRMDGQRKMHPAALRYSILLGESYFILSCLELFPTIGPLWLQLYPLLEDCGTSREAYRNNSFEISGLIEKLNESMSMQLIRELTIGDKLLEDRSKRQQLSTLIIINPPQLIHLVAFWFKRAQHGNMEVVVVEPYEVYQGMKEGDGHYDPWSKISLQTRGRTGSNQKPFVVLANAAAIESYFPNLQHIQRCVFLGAPQDPVVLQSVLQVLSYNDRAEVEIIQVTVKGRSINEIMQKLNVDGVDK